MEGDGNNTSRGLMVGGRPVASAKKILGALIMKVSDENRLVRS